MEDPNPPRVPSPRGEITQVTMSWDAGPLPRRLAGIGSLLTRHGAPGGHWQGCGRAWGACGPLGAGGCSRGCGRSTRQGPALLSRPTLHPRVAVTHTVKVTQAIWSDVHVHHPPWPHPRPPAPWGIPPPPSLQMALARWAWSMPSGKQEGQTGSAWQGRVSPGGTEQGLLKASPWGYKRNPRMPGGPCRTL